jgi:hypothetical protein
LKNGDSNLRKGERALISTRRVQPEPTPEGISTELANTPPPEQSLRREGEKKETITSKNYIFFVIKF